MQVIVFLNEDEMPRQWESALSFACSLLGLECKAFMVRISFDQKPYRKLIMQTWGAPA